MTPLQIVQNRRLLDQVIEVMRERNLFDAYHLVPIRDLHNSDIMKMNELLDWTVLEFMDEATLAADYGLMRLPTDHDDAQLCSPWLEQHIAATRR